jgi:hypothetical protein
VSGVGLGVEKMGEERREEMKRIKTNFLRLFSLLFFRKKKTHSSERVCFLGLFFMILNFPNQRLLVLKKFDLLSEKLISNPVPSTSFGV